MKREDIVSQIDTIINGHMSDCATHNEPAHPKGICNCRPDGLLNKSDEHEILLLFWRTPVTYSVAWLYMLAQHQLDIHQMIIRDEQQEIDIMNAKYG